MKITLKQLHASFPALDEFGKQQIPNRRVAYIVSRILEGTRTQYEKIEAERVDLVKKYGEEVHPGYLQVVDKEKEKKYRKEWDSLTNMEIDFWGYQIGLDQIPENLIPSPADLSKLLWLFKEEAEEPAKSDAAKA